MANLKRKQVMFTEKQIDYLKEKAEELGVSDNEYLRAILFEKMEKSLAKNSNCSE